MQLKKLILYFLTWRILLFVFLFLAIQILPLQFNFLGVGLSNYLQKPYLWSWVNFDGEHYIDIAYSGYKPLTYFYFPFYPILVRLTLPLFGSGFINYAYSGLFVSHVAFLLGLVGLIKLIRLDYQKEIAHLAVLLLLLFPTSFYFGSFYTESLFFALTIWAFYFAGTKRWILAGVLGALSSATRVVGIAIFPALIVEAILQWRDHKSNILISLPSSFGVLLGLVSYASILGVKVGDPLEFFHSVDIFGPQRASGFILFPKVIYRYVFKILTNIDYSYFPIVFSSWLEFLTAILFGGLGVLGILGLLRNLGKVYFVKLRPSYVVYLILAYLIPTFSGSFSSMPRYVLIIFPAFILSAVYMSKLPRLLQALII